MLRRRTAILVVTGLFIAALLLSLLTHSTGVVRNDPARNIWIPGELTMPLQLQVAFNDTQIFFRYRWPAKEPHVLTDLLRYSDGKWQRQSRTPIGSDPDGLAEDRLSMMLDDGSVPEFQRYGGYITVGANMRDFTGSGADAAHRRKYLPATRKDPGDWYSIADARHARCPAPGGLLPRSLALARAPVQSARPRPTTSTSPGTGSTTPEKRCSSATGMPTSGQPRWMFDPDRGGVRALRWEDVAGCARRMPGNTTTCVEDARCRSTRITSGARATSSQARCCAKPSDSRAEIRVQGQGRWVDGYWDVTLVRALDTGHPLEDKVLRDQGVYTVALSVHRDARASRWHYVSLPLAGGSRPPGRPGGHPLHRECAGLGRPSRPATSRFSTRAR